METRRVKAKNGRMVERTYLSAGERIGLVVAIAVAFVFALFMSFAR